MAVWGGLTNSCEKKRSEKQRRKRREFQNDAFIWHQTGAVRFSFDKEVAWTLDGEYGGTHKDVGIKIHRQKLRILIPNA